MLNSAVELISYLPHAVLENIRFPKFQMMSLLLVIFLLILTNSFGHIKRAFFLILSLILMVLIFQVINFHIKEDRKELIVYNLRNSFAVSLIDGHRHILLSSLNDKAWFAERAYLEKYWVNREILRNMEECYLPSFNYKIIPENDSLPIIEKIKEGIQLNLHHLSLLLLIKPITESVRGKTLIPSADILLICPNSGFPTAFNCPPGNVKRIITAGKLSYRQKRAWKQFADYQHIEFYSVHDSGAFHEVY
jgi:hypothetical protein